MKINQALKDYFAKSYFKNFSYLLGENIVRLFLGFFVSILVARHLGPAQYGELNYILSCVHILIPLYTFGVDEFMVKNLVETSSSQNDIDRQIDVMKIGFFAKSFGALLAIFSLYLLSRMHVYQFDNETQLLALAYSLAMVLRSFDVIDNWFQARMEIKKLSIIRTTVLFLAAILKCYYIYVGKNWEAFLFVSAIEIVLVETFYLIIYFKESFKSFFSINLKIFQTYKTELINTALPVIGVSFLTYAISRVDQIMIGNMLGEYELGKFSVAVKLVDVWQFLPFAVINSFYPVIIEAFSKNDLQTFENKLKKLYGALGLMALSFSVIVYFLAPLVINILYGEKYLGAGYYLSLYCWLTIPVFYLYALIKVLVLEKNVLGYFYLLTLTFLLNISLNYLLIPLMGVSGAIVAAICSYVISLAVGAIASKSLRNNLFLYLKGILEIKSFLKIRI